MYTVVNFGTCNDVVVGINQNDFYQSFFLIFTSNVFLSPKFIYKYFIFSPDNHFTHLKIVKKVKGVVIPFRDQNNHMVPLSSYVASQQTFVGLQDVLKTC